MWALAAGLPLFLLAVQEARRRRPGGDPAATRRRPGGGGSRAGAIPARALPTEAPLGPASAGAAERTARQGSADVPLRRRRTPRPREQAPGPLEGSTPAGGRPL